jgi:Tol biopolymer transport system component
LTSSDTIIHGLAWHADDKEIVFSSELAMLSYLYRVPVDGEGIPERIELAGVGARQPSMSRLGRRLVFTRRVQDREIQRVEPGGRSVPVFSSSLADYFPDLSPDGSRIAFTSSRNGITSQVWTANVDGTNLVQLTDGPGSTQGNARWSPDGRSLAFDSQAEDGTTGGVWVVESRGGQPRRVTREASVLSTWSLDGQSLYVRSTRSGRPEIWRVPLSGDGRWEQVTTEGVVFLLESPHPKAALFYLTNGGSLRARPLAGAAAETVLENVVPGGPGGGFAVAKNGIYYWGRPEGGLTPLRFLDWSSRRSQELLRVFGPQGLTASPDGRTVFYASYLAPPQQNLWLLEEFR